MSFANEGYVVYQRFAFLQHHHDAIFARKQRVNVVDQSTRESTGLTNAGHGDRASKDLVMLFPIAGDLRHLSCDSDFSIHHELVEGGPSVPCTGSGQDTWELKITCIPQECSAGSPGMPSSYCSSGMGF